jgi:hypothetical protein
VFGLLAAMPTLIFLAPTVSLLPEPIGLNLIVFGSGFGAWAFAVIAVARRWEPERVQRVMLFGTIFGGTLAAVALCALLLFA